MKHTEYDLQKAVCKYLKLNYPNVLFLSDTIASIKLKPSQAVRNKEIQKDGFKCPDLIVFAAKNGYNGLMIELKTKTPFFKGEYKRLKKNEHIEAQSMYLTKLNELGYFACFAWSLEMAMAIIDNYIGECCPYQPHTEIFYKYFDR